MAPMLALRVVSAVAENHEAAGPNPYLIGVVAFIVLMTLLLVTVAFRSVGQRQRFAARQDAGMNHGSHAGGAGHDAVGHRNPARD